jgi:hypothetical protein
MVVDDDVDGHLRGHLVVLPRDRMVDEREQRPLGAVQDRLGIERSQVDVEEVDERPVLPVGDRPAVEMRRSSIPAAAAIRPGAMALARQSGSGLV